MTKMIFIISLSFLFIPISFSGSESNLEDFSYPLHECGKKVKKPKKPSKVTAYEDIEKFNTAIVEYNIEVANYNKTIKTYKSCINQYIQNGNHDINIIRNTLNKALKEARAK